MPSAEGSTALQTMERQEERKELETMRLALCKYFTLEMSNTCTDWTVSTHALSVSGDLIARYRQKNISSGNHKECQTTDTMRQTMSEVAMMMAVVDGDEVSSKRSFPKTEPGRVHVT